MKYTLSTLSFVGLLAACTEAPNLGGGPDPTTGTYSDPSASGLIAVRAYPEENSICMVIGENDLTIDFLDDMANLIGCPKTETGAIGDRIAEGGVIVGQAGDWTLLSVPDER